MIMVWVCFVARLEETPGASSSHFQAAEEQRGSWKVSAVGMARRRLLYESEQLTVFRRCSGLAFVPRHSSHLHPALFEHTQRFLPAVLLHSQKLCTHSC